ncbi:MAG: hypothetical protein EOP48_08835 [Sphingobacteriales bacterium]|nr:MAG: hypothetical protein EOP48_08835 [Sphingobacteriales bacterium]
MENFGLDEVLIILTAVFFQCIVLYCVIRWAVKDALRNVGRELANIRRLQSQNSSKEKLDDLIEY